MTSDEFWIVYLRRFSEGKMTSFREVNTPSCKGLVIKNLEYNSLLETDLLKPKTNKQTKNHGVSI